MPLTYTQYQNASKFWKEISVRLDSCMCYMRNPTHLDKKFISVVSGVLLPAKELCDYRAKDLLEKATALETLAGE